MNWLKNKCSRRGSGLSRHLIAIVVSLLLALPLQAQPDELLQGGEWTQEVVARGITLHRIVFTSNLFDSNQYLCVLEVAPGARFDIVPADDQTLEKTTALAAKAGAIAAVNGSFFRMRAPYGSVNYLRVDGEENAPNSNDMGRRNQRSIRQTGAIATTGSDLYILKGDGQRTWEQVIAAEDVLTSGPLLLIDTEPEPVAKDKFNTNRHPRTAVGRRTDGTVIFLVADGRNAQAAGLSMTELQEVMAALGCRDAINLDGGGSTTMVVRGQIVNHPCDNKQFDAAGERPVANAIVVRR